VPCAGIERGYSGKLRERPDKSELYLQRGSQAADKLGKYSDSLKAFLKGGATASLNQRSSSSFVYEEWMDHCKLHLIYSNADDDTRRTMSKSYQTSGETDRR
jgi:hypothetical protein